MTKSLYYLLGVACTLVIISLRTTAAQVLCDDLTGRWDAEGPVASMCLDVDAQRQGEMTGLFRNGTDPFWEEVVGRTILNDYQYVGFSGIWPYNTAVKSFIGECFRCDGSERIILDAIVKENSSNIFCGNGGTVSFTQRFTFTRTTSGACQSELSKNNIAKSLS